MRRGAGLALGVLALSNQMACLIWPFPTGHLLAGRGRITPQYVGPLKAGEATREDALLRLGEPDEVLEGGRVLIYRWTEVRGFLFVGAYGGGAAAPFPGHRAVRLEFGADARLVRIQFERGTARAGPEADGDT
jgi:hypothetical protein